MQQPIQNQVERPDWVWFLLIAYCLGVVISFGAILLTALVPNGRMEPVGLGIALVVMALRGVGLTRLFFFKTDAWVYLSVALLVILASDALDLLFGGTEFFLQRHAFPRTLAGYVGAAAVTVYAFRIGNSHAAKRD